MRSLIPATICIALTLVTNAHGAPCLPPIKTPVTTYAQAIYLAQIWDYKPAECNEQDWICHVLPGVTDCYGGAQGAEGYCEFKFVHAEGRSLSFQLGQRATLSVSPEKFLQSLGSLKLKGVEWDCPASK